MTPDSVVWFAVARTCVAYATLFGCVISVALAVLLVYDAIHSKESPMNNTNEPFPGFAELAGNDDPTYFTVYKDGKLYLRVPCEVCGDVLEDEQTRADMEAKYGMSRDALINTREPIRLHMEALLRAQFPGVQIDVR